MNLVLEYVVGHHTSPMPNSTAKSASRSQEHWPDVWTHVQLLAISEKLQSVLDDGKLFLLLTHKKTVRLLCEMILVWWHDTFVDAAPLNRHRR